MNSEQLLALLSELVADEDRLAVQSTLVNLNNEVAALVSNPAHAPYQTAVAETLDGLTAELEELRGTYTPSVWSRMEQIGATPYFSPALTARLRQSMADNSMTPAVVQTECATLVEERESYIARLRATLEGLESFGFEADGLEEGESEVGFEIPRALFKNELDGFSKELHELRLIIRAFSEVAGQRGESAELRQISTTDPLIFVLVSIYTAKQIAKGVEWCLHQWKTVEEIRTARATTASLKVPAAAAMVAQFDEMIAQSVDQNTRKEAERLAAEAGASEARQNELANHLSMALAGLLARIERGMTVEIRLNPPAEPEEDAADETAELTALRHEFAEVQEVTKNLEFPKAVDEPLLRLAKQPEKSSRKKQPTPKD